MAKKIKIKTKKPAEAGFDTAIRQYESGNIRGAEMTCAGILQKDPAHPGALHLTGVIAGQTGQYDVSIDFISKAIHINPSVYYYYNDIGVSFRSAGRLDEAIENFQKAVELKPDFAGAFNNMGITFSDKGLIDEAIENFRKALSLKPDYTEARNNLEHMLKTGAEKLYNLGNELSERGLTDEAIENFQKAVGLKPDYAEAYNNLGIAFAARGLLDNAVEVFKKAIGLKPDYAEAYNNLGSTLVGKDLPDDAIGNYQKAIGLKPDYAEAYNNLAGALYDKGLIDEAIENYRKALSLKSDFDKAYNNLAVVLKDKGILDEAINNYRKALELNPYDFQTHANLGMAYLLSKDFDRGWDKHEWRLKTIKLPPLTKPQWDGTSLEGKTILVHPEQGYGDTLQFARYLPELYEDFGAEKVLFMPQKGLEQLLRNSDLKADILNVETPVENLEFDTDIYLLSLPRIFKTNLDNIPFRQKRYLKANPEKVNWYREKFFDPTPYALHPTPSSLPPTPLRIGIFWQGNPGLKPDRNRSMPLQHFYPLCRLQGVKIYSLQKGYGIEQLNNLPNDIEIVNLGETFNDFSDTAATIENLDLVICVDTAIGHLSGALGKKTWILLPSHAEWRWHLDMDYSPWYEDVRLFRHKKPCRKDWEEMMERVVEELFKTGGRV